MDVLSRVKTLLLGLEKIKSRTPEITQHKLHGLHLLRALESAPGVSEGAKACLSLVLAAYRLLIEAEGPAEACTPERIDAVCTAISAMKEVMPEFSRSSASAADTSSLVLRELLDVGEAQAYSILPFVARAYTLDAIAIFSRILLQLDRRAAAGLKIRFLGLRRGAIAKKTAHLPTKTPVICSMLLAEEKKRFTLVFCSASMCVEDQLIFEGFVFSLVRFWFFSMSRGQAKAFSRALEEDGGDAESQAMLRKSVQAYLADEGARETLYAPPSRPETYSL